MTEQNEENFLLEPLKKILPSQYPVLKPVRLPDGNSWHLRAGVESLNEGIRKSVSS